MTGTWEHDPLVKDALSALMWCGRCRATGRTMTELAQKPCVPDGLDAQQRPANYEQLVRDLRERPEAWT